MRTLLPSIAQLWNLWSNFFPAKKMAFVETRITENEKKNEEAATHIARNRYADLLMTFN
jgi:hypothetical protein